MIKCIKIDHNYCLTHRWPFDETLLKQMHMWKRIKRTHLYVRTRCDLFVPGPIARASLYQPFKRPISIKQAAQWFRTAKKWDVSTGPLARPFPHLLAPLTHCSALLAPLALRCAHLFAYTAHPLTPELVGK